MAEIESAEIDSSIGATATTFGTVAQMQAAPRTAAIVDPYSDFSSLLVSTEPS